MTQLIATPSLPRHYVLVEPAGVWLVPAVPGGWRQRTPSSTTYANAIARYSDVVPIDAPSTRAILADLAYPIEAPR